MVSRTARVEGAARQPHRQLDAEDLQQAADLVLQVDALALHDLAAGEQRPGVVALDALHVHPAVPARAQDLGDAAGVVLVGLVAHGRQRRVDLAGLHADHVVAGLGQAVGQVLGQRAGLQPHLVDRLAELPQAADQVRHLGRDGPLKPDLAVLVDDADRH